MTFAEIVAKVDGFAWGPWLLILLVGTGIYMSCRVGFIQFGKFGYAMKNTLGRMFEKSEAGEGEITPFQAVTTALAGTVGTGNIAGVTGAIAIGGPGAVFWMWISALFGMVTKYSEVFLAVKYRERNDKGEWAGGPMYYITNGMGKNWKWLAVLFALLAGLASFGIGNMTQVNTIATSINTFIDVCGGNTAANTITLMGNAVPVSSLIIGIIVAVIAAVVLIGGVKRIGSVTEKLVPFMAVVYIIASIAVVIGNAGELGKVFGWIFQGAFTPKGVLGGAVGSTIMLTIQKGVGRGVFSNEAGLGSAPMAHASSSETNPVKQGLFGIFEVFMDTIVICTLTALVVLTGISKLYAGGADFAWGASAGTELVSASFGTILGNGLGAFIVALGIALFALSTILSWALYGTRCMEYLFGTKARLPYLIVFVLAIVVGATLKLDVVWNLADALNGFMAVPNLIAVLVLSPVVIKATKEHFSQNIK